MKHSINKFSCTKSRPIYSYHIDTNIRYSCFRLRLRWGDLEGYCNVQAVISDRKIEDYIYHGIKFYNPEFVSYTDYYPFGFPMPTRTMNSALYRFGFNGQEKDDEVYGEGKSYSAEFWQYDTRL